jgi:hypothetical protein
MLAETLQFPGLKAVSVCEPPLIGFQMFWMTLVALPPLLLLPLIPGNS